MFFGQFKNQGSISQSVGYKSYVAVISQNGASAPTVDYVLYNDIDPNITYNYEGVGNYSVQSALSAFTSGKTFLNISQTYSNAVDTNTYIYPDSSSVFYIETSELHLQSNDVLSFATLEVRVYP